MIFSLKLSFKSFKSEAFRNKCNPAVCSYKDILLLPRKFSLQFVKSLYCPQLFLSECEANHRGDAILDVRYS